MGKRANQRNNNRWRSSPEWYTPAWLLDRISAFYGGEYLDPCPASYGHLQGNGLSTSWRGKVFCNPPYGKPIAAWIIKAMTEPVDELILLVPASTDTQWFAPLFAHTVLFVSGRLVFCKHGVSDQPAPHASVLVYRGPRRAAFAEAFADLGPVLRTYHPRRAAQPQLLEAVNG